VKTLKIWHSFFNLGAEVKKAFRSDSIAKRDIKFLIQKKERINSKLKSQIKSKKKGRLFVIHKISTTGKGINQKNIPRCL